MITKQKQTVGLQEGGRPVKTGAEKEPVSKPALAYAGIDKKLSAGAQKIAQDCGKRKGGISRPALPRYSMDAELLLETPPAE